MRYAGKALIGLLRKKTTQRLARSIVGSATNAGINVLSDKLKIPKRENKFVTKKPKKKKKIVSTKKTTQVGRGGIKKTKSSNCKHITKKHPVKLRDIFDK